MYVVGPFDLVTLRIHLQPFGVTVNSMGKRLTEKTSVPDCVMTLSKPFESCLEAENLSPGTDYDLTTGTYRCTEKNCEHAVATQALMTIW